MKKGDLRGVLAWVFNGFHMIFHGFSWKFTEIPWVFYGFMVFFVGLGAQGWCRTSACGCTWRRCGETLPGDPAPWLFHQFERPRVWF